jgi:hypothetical protein
MAAFTPLAFASLAAPAIPAPLTDGHPRGTPVAAQGDSLQPEPRQPEPRQPEPRRPQPQRYDVIHVERAFSAQPTLGDALGSRAVVHELPLAEALASSLAPDLIWASDATPDLVHLLRTHFPTAGLLATLPRDAGPKAVLTLLDEGADLVLRDEGILLTAAALQAMARRLPPLLDNPEE